MCVGCYEEYITAYINNNVTSFRHPIPTSLIFLIKTAQQPNQRLALPLLSKGNAHVAAPAATNSVPLTYTGAAVSRFA